MNSKAERLVEIPVDQFVECPKHRMALRQAVKCEGCEFFLGLRERMSGENLAFNAQYQVVCAKPKARLLIPIDLSDLDLGKDHARTE